MSTKKKLLEAAAGAAGGVTYVDDVFSTYLYEGNGSTQTITNGIDLSGEGGLVWIKNRDGARHHGLFDTVRGATKALYSNQTWSEGTESTGLTVFNSNGFSLGSSADFNGNNESHVGWTFRKQPGFFDVVTYTGNSQSVSGVNQTISHNLGTEPGMIIVKRTDGSRDWMVYHRSLGATKYLKLNTTDLEATSNHVWVQTPTSTEFYVGQDYGVNGTNHEYVAYLFAHDAQDFGEDSDEAIIKCGSYTGNGSTTGPVINLGFEPQWVMIKCSSHDGQFWMLFDSMRGLVTNGADTYLLANDFSVENSYDFLSFLSNGFQPATFGSYVNANGYTYTYMAIRRPNKPASEFAATDLFAIDSSNSTGNAPPQFYSGFPVDMSIKVDHAEAQAYRYRETRSRLAPSRLKTNTTDAEVGSNPNFFDMNDGVYENTTVSTNHVAWMWRRALGFFDVVTYEGDGQAGRAVPHNLGVAPEMMWVKRRDGNGVWQVYANPLGATDVLQLHVNSGSFSSASYWNNTSPTESVFTVGNAQTINTSTGQFIAYLFASTPGISKVGSYTGTGNDLNVDCGFSAGARFVLVKRADSAGDWYVWDSVRGIVAGNDPYLLLNSDAAQVTNTDYIDPLSSGFTITSSAPVALNASGGNYIFLAIA